MPFGFRGPRSGRSTLLTGTAGLVLVAGLSTGLAAPAAAAAPPAAVVDTTAALPAAAQHLGVPYRLGGTTPAGFDCSGFTGFVFRQLGVHLPRTAHQQMLATRPVAAHDARPGDLVFFLSRGGRAHHVGIYSGDGKMFDSPRAGRTVSERRIWASTVVFHRVGG
ncbi:NlpC/P60 family protein [Kineococcus xinjiangensis]|uniref:NlpC/P60 family protein n=1 Tax=Kineococcus xinjiangensis TaxID=512762 RepID=A0A2S6IHV3_9ACTN|nr:C40 family peptidase [Kineococcus xinjiangensis]PPK93802.1 NlpC/P60 family protein [Kineococcus xinjiangensis]